MRSGLFMPLFDELADPAVVARLCVEAEEAGWHGVFVWDNLRYREPVVEVADPWITLAALATATERIRLGPMVTPLARRRRSRSRAKRRRSTGSAAADSGSVSAWAATGSRASTRSPVHHRGEHYTVDGMRFLPRPVQRPGLPVWVAGYDGKPRPVRRAARHQGFFPSPWTT